MMCLFRPSLGRVDSFCRGGLCGRGAVLGIVLIGIWVAAAVPAAARTAVLTTKDGSTYEGELVAQTSTVIVLNVGGIDASFSQDDVASLTIRESPEEIYHKKRAALADDDLDGRYELAKLMYEEDALSLARRELVSLQREFPDVARVGELLNVVEAKLKLEQTRSDHRQDRSRAGGTDRSEDRPGRQGPSDEHPYLTADQINLIRVYEVDLDTKPRVTVSSRAINQLFERYGDRDAVPRGRRERSEFKRLPGYEQLDMFFRVQARDLYDQIIIRTEPEPLSQYRRSVNSQYVARFFAPTFGQGAIDGLLLFNGRPDDEAEAYTNFYFLTTFRYEGNSLIDRDDPEMSLLLQWGLDREAAKFPAPDVAGWRPQFRSTQDADFRRYVEWIGSLFDGEPDYGITYPPQRGN
ncbi:MAG: hypothetical protein AAF333_03325 [Planctomycetota bacterium]